MLTKGMRSRRKEEEPPVLAGGGVGKLNWERQRESLALGGVESQGHTGSRSNLRGRFAVRNAAICRYATKGRLEIFSTCLLVTFSARLAAKMAPVSSQTYPTKPYAIG